MRDGGKMMSEARELSDVSEGDPAGPGVTLNLYLLFIDDVSVSPADKRS